ncbi:MAG: class II aldolase/adducin family protein [Chloroflexales bacterium]|nr:class II aldolase/adducin family protein [Chloroflexales bacterium]
MLLAELRQQVLETARKLMVDQLVHGSQGNVSAIDRERGLIAITPSASDYTTMTADDITVIDQHEQIIEGRWRPSIETPLHTLFYQRRPDVGAVIHCHAPYASGFAAALRPIPLVLSEGAACIGHEVPVAPFLPSGTAEFAQVVLETIGQGSAAVLGQHGIVACGVDPRRAYSTIVAVEDNARATIFARLLGVEAPPIPDKVAQSLHQWWLDRYRRTAADA